MLGAPLVYFYVACSLFVFLIGRLAVPQVECESEGTPRFLFAAGAALPILVRGDKKETDNAETKA